MQMSLDCQGGAPHIRSTVYSGRPFSDCKAISHLNWYSFPSQLSRRDSPLRKVCMCHADMFADIRGHRGLTKEASQHFPGSLGLFSPLVFLPIPNSLHLYLFFQHSFVFQQKISSSGHLIVTDILTFLSYSPVSLHLLILNQHSSLHFHRKTATMLHVTTPINSLVNVPLLFICSKNTESLLCCRNYSRCWNTVVNKQTKTWKQKTIWENGMGNRVLHSYDKYQEASWLNDQETLLLPPPLMASPTPQGSQNIFSRHKADCLTFLLGNNLWRFE